MACRPPASAWYGENTVLIRPPRALWVPFPLGLIIIAVAVAVPLIWFLPMAAARDPLAVLSHYFGAAVLILMGLSQLMATRSPGIESVFGGLDRVYVLHKWVGIVALALVLLHDTIDAEMDGLGNGSALEELTETLGEISLYGLLVLVVLSIATFVPYRLWYRTHQFIGAFFAASAFHFLFIAKPFQMSYPPGLYVGAFCLIGVVAYVWTLLPIRRWARERVFVVETVEQTGDAVAVTLKPQRGRLRHRPGQFAFVRFDAPSLSAAHPFTISGGAAAQVWVAGGIGITPFLAWASARKPDAAPAHLFYCVRSKGEAPHLAELQALTADKPGLTLHLIESSSAGRLDATGVQQTTGVDLAKTHVYFCGPAAMRESLQEGLSRLGHRPSRFHFEQFEMRSGIGIRKLAVWLMETVLRRLVVPSRLIR